MHALIGSTTLEWYAIRAGGIVAYALLTLSVLIGIGLAGRVRLERWPRFAIEDLHRFAGILAGVFIGVHVGLLLVNTYVPLSLAEVLVPGTTHVHPLLSACGIVAAELLLALAVANHYRRRLSHRTWRRLHYANFGVWALAFVHGALMGTDRASIWGYALYTGSAAAVAGATIWRVIAARDARGAAPAARAPVPEPARTDPWPDFFA